MEKVEKEIKKIVSEEYAIELHSLLSDLEFTILNCDSIEEGLLGFVAFKNIENEEKVVVVQWSFAKPVIKFINLNEEKDLKKCIDIVEGCIANSEWIECNNPKKLQVGFAKMAQLDSNDESERVYLRLSKIKEMQSFDANFTQIYEKWVYNGWISNRKPRSAIFFRRYR